MTPDEITQAGRPELVQEVVRLQFIVAELSRLHLEHRSHSRLWYLIAGGLASWVLYLLGVRL